MRSLTLKLTLAFLLVGLTGVLLVTLLVGGFTRREFDQFVTDRWQQELVQQVGAYYGTYGTWQGLGPYLRDEAEQFGGDERFERLPQPILLLDRNGALVADTLPAGPTGRALASRASPAAAVPVEVNGEVVGYVQFLGDERRAVSPEPPEIAFLQRTNRAILWSAVGAALLALLLGIVLASTISRPVRELTAATKALAGGALGHQVPVRTSDEIGELAQSFNQMSADLARSNQMRQQMTADIAHDLRTPLSVILGYSEALHDGKLPGTPETYQAMHLQAQQLNRLIEDLRTLSLADAGQLSLQRRPVDPRDLLEHTALAYLPQAESRGIQIAVEGESTGPVLVDPDRLVQVLGNLVSNALRHTPDGGRITLAATPAGGQVRLVVQDTGPGIAAEDLPHVFDRFYRGDKARTADGSSGLGLAIARSLVEANGGRIAVTSDPGEGARFTITLPTPSPAATA